METDKKLKKKSSVEKNLKIPNPKYEKKKISKSQNKQKEEEKKFSSEKLTQLNKDKNIQKEKENRIINKKLYEEINNESKIKQAKLNNSYSHSKTNLTKLNLEKQTTNTTKFTEKKTHNILKENGILDAYKYLIINLCKNGLPKGNLFEYSAYIRKKYEKKWKEK